MKKKLALVYGGPSDEHEVSVSSARVTLLNLDRDKYDVDEIFIHKNGKWQFLPGKHLYNLGEAILVLINKNHDVILPILHGFFGEDGHIQAILETAKLRYVGSDMTSSAIAMDKGIANTLFAANGFNVPRFVIVEKRDKLPKMIKLPLVVKPVAAGSSVGTFIVRKHKDFRKAVNKCLKISKRVMLQEFISGREFTCGVLESQGVAFSVVPTEIVPKSKFFDYQAKYKMGASTEFTPPKLPKLQIEELKKLCLKAHKILGCHGLSRTDFILKGSKFYILETNTMPGMTPTSLLPQGAKAMGISFSQMLDLMIKAAL